MDIMKIESRFSPKSFDYVLCSDVIEHLLKEDGRRLIKSMQLIARKKLIVYTPNGYFPQNEKEGNEYQIHRSGWTVPDMKEMGFDHMLGLHGLKILCKRYPEPLFKPYFVSRGLSSLTQPIVLRNPKLAFQLLCVKEINC